jgi:hypothetical protein
MTINLGTQDLSTRKLVAEREVLPTHLPKIYIYAKEGTTTPQLVVGASRTQMYGEDSFDLRKQYANHATVLSNLVNAQGNACIIQRIKPTDANDNATLRLWLDVLPTEIPLYQRNTDGSIKVDGSNAPLPVPGNTKVDGFKVKWVVEEVNKVLGVSTFGSAAQKPGDQTDATTSVQSTRYPIMDLEVSHFGAYGNDVGLRMWAPTLMSSQPLDSRLLASDKVYPFRMACVRRPDSRKSARVVETQNAEQFINACFKPDTIDDNTDALVYAGDTFIQAYRDLDSAGYPPSYGPFNRMKMYDANVKTLLDLFYAAEQPLIDAFSDFNDVADEEYLFNMISGVSSQNVPYHSFQIVSGALNSVRLNESTNLFAMGGSDGTMNDAAFSLSVAAEVAEYANPLSPLSQDTASNPESIIYDTGFDITTKYALAKFISIRKDTAVVLTTHDVNGPELTTSQESSLAIALRTRLQMYPESDYFGTAAMRAMIVGRSGRMIGTQYRKPLPLAMEVAIKSAKYMGAGNGVWKSGFSFDQAPQNNIDFFKEINATFTPRSVKNKDWANGLNWVDSYTRRTAYFPALKTIYDNDTSILTSYFTMMAVVELQKVGDRAHRRFSGVSSLSNEQLIERVNEFVEQNTAGRFDNRFVIKSNAYFTQADIARGYSWSLEIVIYGPNMKTVQTVYVTSRRLTDLDSTQ